MCACAPELLQPEISLWSPMSSRACDSSANSKTAPSTHYIPLAPGKCSDYWVTEPCESPGERAEAGVKPQLTQKSQSVLSRPCHSDNTWTSRSHLRQSVEFYLSVSLNSLNSCVNKRVRCIIESQNQNWCLCLFRCLCEQAVFMEWMTFVFNSDHKQVTLLKVTCLNSQLHSILPDFSLKLQFLSWGSPVKSV